MPKPGTAQIIRERIRGGEEEGMRE